MNGDNQADVAAAGDCGCGKKRSLGCISALLGMVVLFFCTIILGIGLDAILNFIDIPSMAIVLGVMLGGWLITPGFLSSLRSLEILILNRAQTREESQRAQNFCACGIGYALVGGFLGTLIGIINMLAGGMDNPATLTCGMAVSLITVVYAVLVGLLLLALYYRAKDMALAMKSCC